MRRQPAVAGQFYPGTEASLKKEVQRLLHIQKAQTKEKAIAIVSPHAGYMYSGPVAGCVYSCIEIPETVIILGPNHTGAGATFSLFKEGLWQTPLGDIQIDSELAETILKNSESLQEDTNAHIYEHSLEVQLPFIQYIKKDFKIVPVVLSNNTQEACHNLGASIAHAVKQSKKQALIVASSDMTHYEDQKTAEKKDKLAIDAVLDLDEAKLLNAVQDYNISMCGYIPVVVMLIAAKALGAKEARLVKYQTSGDITGDYSAVVGYAGIILK
jgi:MEMO1 family protein